MLDYYELLRVRRNATQEEIRRSYRDMIGRAHPDRDGNSDYAVLLNQAYETLSKPERRREYDESLQREIVTVDPAKPATVQPAVSYSDALATELAGDLASHAKRVAERIDAERKKRLG